MAKITFSKKGSLMLEESLLIIIVVIALLAVSVVIKRGLCGKWRRAGDSFGYGRQYAPGITEVK